MQAFGQKFPHKVLHVGFGLDFSGSMRIHQSMVPKVVDRLVAHLRAQSEISGQEVRFTLLGFNHEMEYLVWDMDVKSVPSFEGRYVADGGTALMDATMMLLEDMEKVPQLGGDHDFLLNFLTDGRDESSRKVRAGQLADKLKALPVNVTAGALVPDFNGVSYAKTYGFPPGCIAQWDASSSDGFERAVETLTAATTQVMNMTSTGAARGTKYLYSPDPTKINEDTVAALGIPPLDPTKYHWTHVPPLEGGIWIMHYVRDTLGLPYRLGNVFYQLQKDELIAPNKELALMKTGKGAQVVYAGPEIRKLLGLPDDKKVRVAPGAVPGWTVYVQSMSTNRHMPTLGGGLLVRK